MRRWHQHPPSRRACQRPFGGRGDVAHGRGVAALRPDPRHQEGQAGGDAADGRQLGRGGRPDHEADRAVGGLPAQRQPRHPQVERLPRRAAPLLGAHRQVLQLAGARIRGAAQDVRAAARSLKQGRQGRGTDIGRDGHGVGPKAVVQGEAWRAVVLPMSPRLASAMKGMSGGRLARSRSRAANPATERLEEGEVDLDGRSVRQRRLEH